MDRDNIIALLGKHEWNDLEFKKYIISKKGQNILIRDKMSEFFLLINIWLFLTSFGKV